MPTTSHTPPVTATDISMPLPLPHAMLIAFRRCHYAMPPDTLFVAFFITIFRCLIFATMLSLMPPCRRLSPLFRRYAAAAADFHDAASPRYYFRHELLLLLLRHDTPCRLWPLRYALLIILRHFRRALRHAIFFAAIFFSFHFHAAAIIADMPLRFFFAIIFFSRTISLRHAVVTRSPLLIAFAATICRCRFR